MSDMNSSLSTLRNRLYNLEIGSENEKVWIKKLKNILEADIHQKPLGCKISNTHVKIGEVHLDTFYEAQILFSHPRWVNRFANWLYEKIAVPQDKKTLVIGYETYIEPVLVALKDKAATSGRSVDYCLYEEPKYIRSEVKSEQKIRYFEKFILKKKDVDKYNKIVFICGISSTLNTFIKIKDKFLEELEKFNKDSGENKPPKKISDKLEYQYLSIIHVLPKTPENESETTQENGSVLKISDSKTLFWESGKKTATLEIDKKKLIKSQYLVSVNCTWYQAQECELCFPSNNPMEERPIIATSETSVIPIQMIKRDSDQSSDKNNRKTPYIDFFKKKKDRNYMYQNYLYYNHIDREDHHYKYYVRTGNLFYDIYYGKEFEKERAAFLTFCDDIKNSLGNDNSKEKSDGRQKTTNNETFLDVIIAPSHFSNELFPHAINRHVFGGNAHVIAFEPKKEYRSNFETKFSNIEYFLEQIKTKNDAAKVKVRFHYVDDQIVTGSTFARAKSLLSSLMRGNSESLAENVIIFDQVITFVSRMSDKTKKDYVCDDKNTKKGFKYDVKNYHSFIDFAVPSIRNYGDSCPSCNIRYKAQDILESAALKTVAEYWSKKHYDYRVKSLKEAKNEAAGNDDEKRRRQFRRFDCENELWTKTKYCNTVEDYTKVFAELLNGGSKSSKEHIEKAISVLKAISSPFLYYKEILKKAALKTVIALLHSIIEDQNIYIDEKVLGKKINIVFKDEEQKEKYNFINILINCLAQMESTYILNKTRIKTICNLMKALSNKSGWEKYYDADGYYTILLNAYKRIICGIAGEQKNERFRKEILTCITDEQQSEYKDLFEAMYLESISKGELFLPENDEKKDDTRSVLEKYSDVCKMLCKQGENIQSGEKTGQKSDEKPIKCVTLYYKDDSMNGFKDIDEIWYIIASSDDQEIRDGYVLCKEIINDDQHNLLNKIGYCAVGDEKDKYVFDLMFFSDEYQRKMAKSKTSETAMPYIEITFNDKCDLVKKLVNKLEINRQILAKKYALAKMLDGDIEKGSVKSAIQARASQKLISEGRNNSHNERSEFLNTLRNMIVNNIDNDAEKTLKLITILFDQMIAYANNLLVLAIFYGQNIRFDKQPFIRDFYFIGEDDKKLIKAVLNYRFGENFNDELNNLQCGILMMEERDSVKSEMAGVYLAGVILKFIENAEKHGKPSSLACEIKKNDDDDMEIIFSNEIGEKKNVKSKGMTKKFFVTFLNILPRNGYEIQMGEENGKYISKLIIFNKNDGKPKLNNVAILEGIDV